MTISKYGPWTKNQISKLYELYPEVPTWKLLEEFKPRDLMNITSKACKLGIKRTNKYRFETFSKINRNKDFIEKNKRIFSTKKWKETQSKNIKNFWNNEENKKFLLTKRTSKLKELESNIEYIINDYFMKREVGSRPELKILYSENGKGLQERIRNDPIFKARQRE